VKTFDYIASIFIVEYLREYEYIFETSLAHESMNSEVLLEEKKPKVETLVWLSLTVWSLHKI
jgi:hypothetical protein